MKVPYLLADDLSGALEAGAAFRTAGWRVVLPLAAGPPLKAVPGVLPVVSTETRTATPTDAVAAVRRVLADRRAAGATLLFKKIDSTLRGPIGAELSAMVAELAPRLVVVCPANPAVGRTVVDGMVRVGGVPLHETAFRDDPAWPTVTGDVRARLESQGAAMHGHISLAQLHRSGGADFGVRWRPAGQGTVVLTADAETEADLRTLVRSVLAGEPGAIFVGSGGLSLVLAEFFPPPRIAVARPVLPATSLLVLCGSRHPASHRQAAVLAAECGARILIHSPEAAREPLVESLVAELEQHGLAVLTCDLAAAGLAPTAVPLWLADIAAATFTRRSVDALYLTGGETAFAICRRLGAKSIEIVRVIEPGVVQSEFTLPSGSRVALVTKPGGYGDENAMIRHRDLIMK